MSSVGTRIATWAIAIAFAFSMIPQSSARAAAGLTLSDFKLKHAVAEVGSTVAITLEGTMDRDLHLATGGLRKSPAFTIEQSCRSDSDPSTVQVASQTNIFPFVSFSSTTTFADRGQGNKTEWTVTLNYDPAADFNVGHPNPPGPNTLCPAGFSPSGALTVTHVQFRVWPGTVGSPPRTAKGELLWIVLGFDAGETTFGLPR